MLKASARQGCVFVLSLLILCSLIGCQQKEDNGITQINPADQVSIESMTLLERTGVKLDDQSEAYIELYTSAAISEDALMNWDTGDQWSILAYYNDQIFVLFDEYVQYGEVQFWVSDHNPKNILSPEPEELEHHIYVMVTDGVGFRMYDTVWDAEKGCFQKTISLNPDNQWNVFHSNKYNTYDATRIQNSGNSSK